MEIGTRELETTVITHSPNPPTTPPRIASIHIGLKGEASGYDDIDAGHLADRPLRLITLKRERDCRDDALASDTTAKHPRVSNAFFTGVPSDVLQRIIHAYHGNLLRGASQPARLLSLARELPQHDRAGAIRSVAERSVVLPSESDRKAAFDALSENATAQEIAQEISAFHALAKGLSSPGLREACYRRLDATLAGADRNVAVYAHARALVRAELDRIISPR